MDANLEVVLNEIADNIMSYHGCTTGDCPHDKQSDCFRTLIKAGAEEYLIRITSKVIQPSLLEVARECYRDKK